jgi:hypothetical protein
LKLTEFPVVRFEGFRVEPDKSRLKEAKLKLLKNVDTRLLRVLVEIREAIEEGTNTKLVIEFITRLKVVKNQFSAAEDKELNEKFTLNIDIRLKLLEKR